MNHNFQQQIQVALLFQRSPGDLDVWEPLLSHRQQGVAQDQGQRPSDPPPWLILSHNLFKTTQPLKNPLALSFSKLLSSKLKTRI